MIVIVVSWKNDKPTKYSIFKDKILIKSSDLWKSGTNKKIIDVKKEESTLIKLLLSLDEFVIVNFKKFIDYFKIIEFNTVYDYPGDIEDDKHLEFVEANWEEFGKVWQKLRSQAAIVYHKLERKGVMYEHKLMKPAYDMNVFSGRSSTTGFNIQGCNKEFNITHINPRNNVFIHFDWMAADHRIAAILSNDQDLLGCYKDSDPYTYIVNILDGEVDRDQCKSEFMQAVYGLNPDHEILSVFPSFRDWIAEKVKELNDIGYVRSMLGRKYETDKTVKGNRRAFNSIMQGGVAHAMNNVIYKIDHEFGEIILTEQHDSLTLCVNELMIVKTIKGVSDIMLHPFHGILENNPTMPLRVHIGKRWREYKQVKEIR
jgi:hypothetical protein